MSLAEALTESQEERNKAAEELMPRLAEMGERERAAHLSFSGQLFTCGNSGKVSHTALVSCATSSANSHILAHAHTRTNVAQVFFWYSLPSWRFIVWSSFCRISQTSIFQRWWQAICVSSPQVMVCVCVWCVCGVCVELNVSFKTDYEMEKWWDVFFPLEWMLICAFCSLMLLPRAPRPAASPWFIS